SVATRCAAATFLRFAGEGCFAHGGLRDAVGTAAGALAALLTVARCAVGDGLQTKFLSFRRIGHNEIPV
nr:hypothetical protein [Pseudomonas sp.]